MGKGILFFHAALLIAGLSSQALAGEKLRLKSGEVDVSAIQPGLLQRQQSRSAILDGRVQTSPYHLIQFNKPLSLADRKKVEDLGVEFLRYIPDDGYVVRATDRQLDAMVAANVGLRGHAPYAAQYKVSSDFQTLSVFQRERAADIQMYLFTGADHETVSRKAESLGAKVVFTSDRVLRIQAPMKLIPELAGIDGVEWVQEKVRFKKFDFELTESTLAETPMFRGDYTDLTGYESGTAIMNFEEAWRTGASGRGEFVIAADTGLDTGDMESLSTDFSNLALINIYGIETDSWADIVGHGTHVLGSVGSSGNSSDGFVIGGAYRAALGMQSMWSHPYEGLTVPDDIRVLFDEAYNVGSRIHTNSWGSGNPRFHGRYEGDAYMVDEYSWTHPDMLILFAAGNDGADLDRDGRIDPGSVSPPSTAKNSLTVGASENLVAVGGVQGKLGELNNREWGVEPIASDSISDNPNGLVAFSARGPTMDGRIKPDVVAPGSNILSNCSRLPESGELWGRYNDRHCFCGGTSMSTPLVAGAAALVREHLTRISGIDVPSSALVKAVLMHTAFDMYPGQYGEIGEAAGQEILTPGPNYDQGFGRVDVGRALTDFYYLVDDWEGVGTGEFRDYAIPGAVGKVTLVYTDYPGAPNADHALVNDLKLEVIVGNQSYQNESLVDNSEQVHLPRPVTGARIIVSGQNVPMGKDGRQPFSLVISEY